MHIQSLVDVVSVLVWRVLTCYEYVNCNTILFTFHVCFITQIRNSMNTATYVQTAVFLYSSHYIVSNFYEHCKYRVLIWSDFDRVSSLICGNKMPTRCNRCFLLQILLLAQHVSAEGYVSGLRAASPPTGHITLSSSPYRQLENQSTKYHRQQPSV